MSNLGMTTGKPRRARRPSLSDEAPEGGDVLAVDDLSDNDDSFDSRPVSRRVARMVGLREVVVDLPFTVRLAHTLTVWTPRVLAGGVLVGAGGGLGWVMWAG